MCAVGLVGAIAIFMAVERTPEITTDCEAQWYDVYGETHCGHHLEFIRRVQDSTKVARADLFKCHSEDGKAIYIPIPRHFIANTTP